ncbi:unnamed protein product [Prorocentrum cordatum]|uniref:Selenoprotein O n=1 Tax=Prorocentrum cordatum TaxID=2364126 RepID=A0ABN9S883_9DINO|nr:unnamed protein product [Polarella glacialis]
MSIVGLTLDYGPFGFMEWFEPDFAPNGSDAGGRYAYRAQPEACRFGCERLAEALGPALPLERSRPLLATWDDRFQAAYLRRMRVKLGLVDATGDAEEKDRALVDQLLETMEQTYADWTLTFRILCDFDPAAPETTLQLLVGVCAEPKVRASMVERKADMSKASMPPKQVRELWEMCQNDPERVKAMFPGSSLEGIIKQMKVELARAERAEAAESRLRTLRGVDPRDQASRDEELWARWLRLYGGAGLADEVGAPRRREAMRAANPAFVPRNWVLQEAIEAAYGADFSRVHALLQRVAHPFEEADAQECPAGGGCDWLRGVLACQCGHYRPPGTAVALLTTWPL